MGGPAMEEPSMAEIAERLRGELSDTLELIRRAGGGLLFEEFPGDLEENAPQPDEADAGRAGEAREASSATQRMLIDEANRLAEMLDRLRRGKCGVSEGTRALVAAAPLRGQRNAPVTRHHGP
jgi:hypothetical protein